MSVQATTWVWTHSKAQDNTLLVALAIADAANAQGAESCQSVRTICRMTRAGETTVHRAIRWLIEAGEIEWVGVNPRYGNTRVYQFPALWPGGVAGRPAAQQGGADMAGGAIGGTGGVPSEPPGGAVGGTQPHKDTPEEHPSASGDASGGDEPKADDGGDVAALFADWWQVYPKKVDKKKASEAFAKAHKRVGYETLKAGLVRYVQALRAEGKVSVTAAKVKEGEKPAVEVRLIEGAKVLNPTTWLNGDRWEDQHDTATAPAVAERDENGAESWMHRTRGE